MSSTSTLQPQPNVGQISLPPGMTTEQFMRLQGQLVTIAITLAVACAVVVWDYFVQLPDELALYMTKNNNTWRRPATWSFLILRYSGILASIPSLFFTSVQSRHCQVAVVASQVGVILAVASSGIIFCYRVFAIWNGVRLVTGVMCVMYLIMLGCWIADSTQYKAITGPPTAFGSNCQITPVVTWAPISYASSVAFDSVVLVLTVAKLHGSDLALTKSRVRKQIYRDNLIYFTLTTVTNVAVLSIEALGPKYDMIKPAAIPFSTVMTVTMGTRVFLNLKLFDQRQQAITDSLVGIPLNINNLHEGSNRLHLGVVEIKEPNNNVGYAV